MKKRGVSLLIILGIYLLAFGGAFIFSWYMEKLNMNIYLNLLLANVIATTVIFIFNLILKNASVYDAYWSIQTIYLVVMLYALGHASFSLLHLIILIPMALWSIRLTLNWVYTFENLSWEDWRYVQYKKNYPKIAQLIVFGGIMMMPTLLVFVGSFPLLYVLRIDDINIAYLILGAIIILLGVTLELFADMQMHKHIKSKEKGVLNKGLWYYSRHPNYLGENLIWIGVFVSSLTSFYWITILSPLLILLLFEFISIPLAEKRCLENIPNYDEYKTKTSRMILLPKKRK